VRAQIRDQATDHRAILILPIDLPRADKGALSAFIHRKGDVVIAPDQRLSSSSAGDSSFRIRFRPKKLRSASTSCKNGCSHGGRPQGLTSRFRR
jgi:2-phospho-L-lactate guanylyltransferase (CobY/MobA/RfbA family)